MELRKITQKEFDEVYDKHQLWWRSGGTEGEVADFSYCDLREINFEGRKDFFCYLSLKGANFQGANLQGTDLRNADFTGANLYGTNFFRANLDGANFEGTNFEDAIGLTKRQRDEISGNKVLNSEGFYEEQIKELKEQLANQSTQGEEEKELLQAQIKDYERQLKEKQKQESAITEWNTKIEKTFKILEERLTPIRFERRKLHTLFFIYSTLIFAALGFIVYFEWLICTKIGGMTEFPAWQDYLFASIPIPVAGAMLWALISQLNRAQRQSVILAKYIHEIRYVEGLLLSINSLSSDISNSMGRVNKALDTLLDNHLNAKTTLRSIDEDDLVREEKKDTVPYDTIIKLLKEIKDISGK